MEKEINFLNKFKNGFINIIRECNLSTEYFTANEISDTLYKYFEIRLKDTPMQFKVQRKYDFNSFECQATKFTPDFSLTYKGSCDTIGAYSFFGDWLKEHVQAYIENLSVPNYWELMEGEGQSFFSTDGKDSEFEKFNKDEITRIRMSINEFKILIVKEFDPSDEEIKLINSRLKYLSDSLDRLNKFDWKGLVVSTLISISITLSMDTNTGNRLFELFKSVFSGAIMLLK